MKSIIKLESKTCKNDSSRRMTLKLANQLGWKNMIGLGKTL